MRLVPFLAAVACVVSSTSAHATSTIVPDNHATIQAAIDANVDTVWVRSGTYNETVSLTHGVFLAKFMDRFGMPAPIVLRLTGSAGYDQRAISVQGIHILRSASVSSNTGCQFTACRADSGLVCNAGAGFVHVTGCLVFGPLYANGFFTDVSLNTVVAGTLTAYANAQSAVSGNYVVGPAETGIHFGEDVVASDNIVRNCVTGITFGGQGYRVAIGNLVEDCSGDGIVSGNPGGGTNSSNCLGNTVRRCGGVGIRAYGITPTIDGNTVDSTGSMGMDLQVTTDHVDNNTVTRANGAGIVAMTIVGHVRGNTVLHCAGDGIRADLCLLMDHNVVGHNGGAGLKATSDYDTRMRSNTSFYNVGPGFSINSTDATADSVVHNIGFGNQVGLEKLGTGGIALGCNDWFGNAGGGTSGVSPGATDFALDPLFCNAPSDVVSLASTSPALNRAGCGLVGALGQGCATPTAAASEPVVRPQRLFAYPQPNRGAMRFAWQPLDEPATLEVFDAQGALRYACGVGAGLRELAWGRTATDGRALPAGVYFARLRAGARELGSCRVVVLD